MKKIKISLKKYIELIRLRDKIEMFEEYVRTEGDFVSVEKSALIFGFDLGKKKGVKND